MKWRKGMNYSPLPTSSKPAAAGKAPNSPNNHNSNCPSSLRQQQLASWVESLVQVAAQRDFSAYKQAFRSFDSHFALTLLSILITEKSLTDRKKAECDNGPGTTGRR